MTEGLERAIHPPPAPVPLPLQLAAANPPESAADVYERVRSALANRKALRCGYESVSSHRKDGERSADFLFEPYSLFFATRAWYAIGFHRGRGEVRCLKLGRFTRVTATDIGYSIPAEFTLESHLGNGWRMIRGKTRYEVELIFDSTFADTIADTHWHKTQQVEWEEDGSIRFRCKVDGLEEIVWWVLSMGPHCRVIKPTQLVARVQALVEQMLAQYQPSVAKAVKKPRRTGTRRRKP
jgi:predicted DNA-binding transcriptional regulator YafY